MTGILIGAAMLTGAILGVGGVAGIAILGLTGLNLGWLKPMTLLLISLAALAGFLRVGRQASDVHPPDWAIEPHAFHATISSSPFGDGQHMRFIATVMPASRSNSERATACVSAPAAPALHRGDRIYVTGNVQFIDAVSPAFADYMKRLGCSVAISANEARVLERGHGPLAWLDTLRQRITRGIQHAAPGDAGALISGLATGDDAALSKPARDAFYATGTSHITAVSGSNLALFVGFFASAGAAAGWLRRLAWQVMTISTLWLYVMLIGMGAPAFRSAIVATLAIIAVRFGRKPDLLTLAALTSAAQIMLRPADVGSLSFRLSTAAAFGLLIALGDSMPRSAWGKARKLVATSCAANLATAPILLASVGLPFPVRSIVANVAIAPIIDVLFPMSVVVSIAGAANVGIGVALAAAPELLARSVLAIVEWSARLPGPTLTTNGLPSSPWFWTLVLVVAFTLLSRETRGGAARMVRRWKATDAAATRAAVLVAMAGLVGAMVGWFSR